MKKMNSLLVFASVFFFLFLVVEGVQAQNSTLAGGLIEASEFKVDISNLVSESQAFSLLSAEYKDASLNMEDVADLGGSAETTAWVKVKYYEYLVETLGNGGNLQMLFPDSITKLREINDQFGVGYNIDLAAIYSEAVNLIQQ